MVVPRLSRSSKIKSSRRRALTDLTRRRLIEKQDFRIEGHGPGYTGRSACRADLGGIKLFEAGHPHKRQFQLDNLTNLPRAQIRIALQGQGDILGQVMELQSAPLGTSPRPGE